MEQLLQSNFAERVLQALKQQRSDTELYDRKVLVATLTPFISEAQQLYVLPYVNDSSTFKALRNVTAANLVRFCVASSIVNIGPVQRLLPLFEGNGPTAEARLFAALHLLVRTGNENYELSRIGDVVKLIDLELIDDAHKVIVGELQLGGLKEWTLRFLSQNPRVQQVLTELVTLIKPTTIADLDLQVQVQFFTCKDYDLYGFSGIGKIFINLTALTKLYERRREVVEIAFPDQEITVFEKAIQIATALIGIHEVANMAIRKMINNVNEKDTAKCVQQRFAFMPGDAGAIAELRLLDFGFLDLDIICGGAQPVNDLFKSLDENNPSAPAVDHRALCIKPGSEVYPGIYKVYPEAPFR